MLVMLTVTSCMVAGSSMAESSSTEPPQLESTDALKNWTVGLYWAVDNDLDPSYDWYSGCQGVGGGAYFTSDWYPDLWENSLTNREDVGLAVFWDGLDGARTIVLDESGWVETQSLGYVNSADPEVLQDFIEYFMAEESLEAQHYLLVIMDHGLGYLGIVADESEPAKCWMSIDDLRGALDGAAEAIGKKLDIVDLDACCMATAEVAYELRDAAGYLVSSQMTVAMDGLNYMGLLEGLSENPCMTPLELACKIVDDYEDWYSAPLGTYPTIYPYMQDFATLSVIDLSKISAVGTAFAAFSNAVLPKDGTLVTPLNRATLHNFVFKWENNMCVGFNADVMGMFEDLAELVRATHPALAELCGSIVSASDEAIVKDWSSWRFQGTPNGMSVFTPPSIGIYDVNWDTLNRVYDQLSLDFVDDTRWDEVLLEYFCTTKRAGC